MSATKAIASLCGSVANKTAMTYGEITFANVMALLAATPTPRPTGMDVCRFAAMVVQSVHQEEV